ncbi:MAG: hypothetical protein R6X15_09485 [Pseudomonadota bacterium]
MINKKSLWKNKFLLFAVSAATILIIAIIYVKTMTMMETARKEVNVNKVEDIEHLVSYSVYSDFYYRVMEIDGDGRVAWEYSRIQPIVAELGLESENGEFDPLIKSRRNGGPFILEENADNDMTAYIDMIDKYALEHGKLVALNDPDYFQTAVKRASELSGGLVKLGDYQQLNVGFEFQELSPPIENIKSTPVLITEIEKNLKSVNRCDRLWCPELFSIEFGESDRIAFQMLWRTEHVTPSDFEPFVKKRSPNSYIYKTVMHHNNIDLETVN